MGKTAVSGSSVGFFLVQLTTLLKCNWKGAVEEEEEEEEEEVDDDDEEYAEVEGDGKDSTALSSVKRGRDRVAGKTDGQEDEGQDAKKVKV